jgi:hypothetical protein
MCAIAQANPSTSPLIVVALQSLQWLPWSSAASAGVPGWVLAAVNASCGYCFWHISEGALWQVSLNASAVAAWGAAPGTSVHNIGRQGDGYLIEDSFIDGNGRCALLKVGNQSALRRMETYLILEHAAISGLSPRPLSFLCCRLATASFAATPAAALAWALSSAQS